MPLQGYAAGHLAIRHDFTGYDDCAVGGAGVGASSANAIDDRRLRRVPIAVLHGEGAQIYQCESDSHDQLVWQPREPIASLILDGDTVGRHYAGLHWGHIDYARFQWEHADGSAVQARIAASAAAASPDDIPWLRLEVTRQTGNGALYGVTAVQRINTRGGMARGSCEKAGSYLGVPFSADYVFWRED